MDTTLQLLINTFSQTGEALDRQDAQYNIKTHAQLFRSEMRRLYNEPNWGFSLFTDQMNHDDNAIVCFFNEDQKYWVHCHTGDDPIWQRLEFTGDRLFDHEIEYNIRAEEVDERGSGPDRYPPILRDSSGRPVDVG